jgi:flagellar biogenesis protein FliO
MLWYASKVLLALIVLIPLLYSILKLLGRRLTVSRSVYGNIEVLDILPLGGGKQLLLVKLAGRVLLLSSSKDKVIFLWEVPDDEVLECQAFHVEDKSGSSIRQWLGKWRHKQQGDGRGEGS